VAKCQFRVKTALRLKQYPQLPFVSVSDFTPPTLHAPLWPHRNLLTILIRVNQLCILREHVHVSLLIIWSLQNIHNFKHKARFFPRGPASRPHSSAG
jgi:hypothetical protein